MGWSNKYCKNLKKLDTWKFCYNHPQICPEDIDGMGISIDPDKSDC